MTALVLSNNAQSTLSAAVTATATQITVDAGQGPLFPSPEPNQWFPLSLVRADGSGCEIVRATSRTGDEIEIIRAREGTTALTFSEGDYVLHQMTAEAYLSLADSGVDTIPTSSGTSSAYNVALENVTGLTDGLAFGFESHATNPGAATLKINTLAAKPIRRYAYGGSDTLVALSADEILLGTQAIVHYNAANDVFILSNPNRAGSPEGSDTTAGLLRLAEDPQDYDPDTGDNSRPVTQLTASQITKDAIENSLLIERVPFIWRNRGRGVGGNFTIGNGNSVQLLAGHEHQYANLTVAAGGTMATGNDGGVRVIRCTDTFTCAGEIQGHRAVRRWPERVVGPTGSALSAGSNQDNPPVQKNYTAIDNPLNTPDQATAIKRFLTLREFEGAVLNGEPMQMFTGGHGDANNTANIPNAAGGGLVIVADTINLQSGGVIANLHAASSALEGPSGGGMVILVANTITIDANFEFELGVAGVPNNRAYYEGQRLTNIEDVPGAGNGHLFTINPSTGVFVRIF